MTQLFDQMTAPDPAPLPLPWPVDEALELDLDLSRFFAPPPPPRRRGVRTSPGAWLRGKAPGLGLVVAGALLGVAVARL